MEVSRLLAQLGPSVATAQAEQVHGGSVALLGAVHGVVAPIPGCDGLWTDQAHRALLIRTADCVPIFFAEPSRGVIGLAHVGWRGVRQQLPVRMISACVGAYRVMPAQLWVAIGPAIRACCYEVGQEFRACFGSFVRQQRGRVTCDLVGAAMEQLTRCGIRRQRVADCARCTACESDHWFSLRREGPSTGRLVSVIMRRP